MPRTPIWRSIAATLEAEIGRGHYRPRRLPTEAALAACFESTGTRCVARWPTWPTAAPCARAGAGVFVAAESTLYRIGKRTRFHQNIRASGRLPRKALAAPRSPPGGRGRGAALRPSTPARRSWSTRLSLAGGIAVAQFESVFPASRLPGLVAALTEVASVTEALARCGIADYIRAETRITAERTTPTQALHLGLREGDPLLRTTALNTTPDGTPVEFGRTWFAGDRVVLTVAPD
ncbi:MAG: UTRA domain-containing protein [Paracoccaceae bacterium]